MKTIAIFFWDPPPSAKVFHATRYGPEYVVGGVRVESHPCPGGCKFAINLKHIFRNVNDITAGDGASTVPFVRGSLLGGRRKGGVGTVLQDMVSYWFTNGWLVVVHVDIDRDLSEGVGGMFSDVGFPCAFCCSCPLWDPGVHKPGAMHHNITGLREFTPPCYNCHVSSDAVDQHLGWHVSQWFVANLSNVCASLFPHPNDQPPSIQHHEVIHNNRSSPDIMDNHHVRSPAKMIPGKVVRLPKLSGLGAEEVPAVEVQWQGGAEVEVSTAGHNWPVSARLAHETPKEEERDGVVGKSHARPQSPIWRGDLDFCLGKAPQRKEIVFRSSCSSVCSGMRQIAQAVGQK